MERTGIHWRFFRQPPISDVTLPSLVSFFEQKAGIMEGVSKWGFRPSPAIIGLWSVVVSKAFWPSVVVSSAA